MKIVRADISGFGKWVDVTFHFKTDSTPLYIYGENEMGKSTLQQFLLFMLFGLPPKKREFYRPKTSGRMGGRLTVEDSEFGLYTIERYDHKRNGAAVISLPDGKELDESWLQTRLYGITRSTYEAIFSFSAMDLNEINDLDEEAIGEILLSIGLSGSSSMYHLEKRLEQRLAELFKPYGKKPMINEKLNQLEQIHQSLKQAKSKEASYHEKVQKLHGLKDQLVRISEEMDRHKKELRYTGKQLQVMPILHEYRHIQKQLSLYEGKDFPENGKERLENLNAKLLPLESESAILKNNQKEYVKKIQELESQVLEDEVFQFATTLYQKRDKWNDQQKQLKNIEEKVNELTVQIQAEIERLQIGIKHEELKDLSLPFHVEKMWNDIKKDGEQINLKKNQYHEDEAKWKQHRNFFMNQLSEIERKIVPEEEIINLQKKLDIDEQARVRHNLQEDALEKQKIWEKKRIKKEKQARNTFIFCIVLSLVLAVLALSIDLSAFIYIALFSILFGFLQWGWNKQSIKEMNQYFQTQRDRSGNPLMPEEEKEQIKKMLLEQRNLKQEWQSRTEQMKENELSQLQLLERKKQIEKQESKLKSNIQQQLERYPVLKQVDIAYWPEFYHVLRRLLEKEQERKHLVTEKVSYEQQLKEIEKEVEQFLIEQHLPKDSPFEQLSKLLRIQKETLREISRYQSFYQDNSKKQIELEEKIAVYRKEIERLFQQANVESEEEYYKIYREIQEKQQLHQQLEQLKLQMEKIFPNETWKKLLDDKNISDDRLERKQEEYTQTLKELEQEFKNKQEETAMLQAEVNTIETSELYSNLFHTFEKEKEQLEKYAKEWAAIKAAKEILRETKRKYQQTYLSKVIERTSTYFCHVTENKYKKIFAPTEQEPFRVERKDGVRFYIHELSQGTIHQLYVSLRLAMSEIMSENYPLPFILDDAFLHFDLKRMERMMEVITEIAKKQQVLYFTCKNDEVGLLEKNGTVRIIENSIRINS